jgi:hypothetical protein
VAGDTLFVFLLLFTTIILFVSDRLRLNVVAIFIPVTLNLAAKAGIQSSRLLMPIAFASLIGGMLTLCYHRYGRRLMQFHFADGLSNKPDGLWPRRL